MCKAIGPLPQSEEVVDDILGRAQIERLRRAGYVLVPLRPTDEMIAVGAPKCFIVPDGTWEMALSDAAECYAAMIKLGCL